MKKLFSYLFCVLCFASTAQALEIEIVPRDLRITAEVMGISAEVNGVAAVIFTGEVAQEIADEAGVAIDTATEMIVATGDEVTALLGDVLGQAQEAGDVVVAVTGELAEQAYAMVTSAIAEGTAVVDCATEHVSAAAQQALDLLNWAYDNAVTVITDAGTQVECLANCVLDLGCSVLDILPISILSCGSDDDDSSDDDSSDDASLN